MRIIRGEFKNRKILPPKNFKSRPTTDFAKEGLFNILENRINLLELCVLDLFCGTGNISLEFLSRGTPEVMAVEQNYAYVRHIKEQIQTMGVASDRFRIFHSDALKFASKKDLSSFGIIFADPPFHYPKLSVLPEVFFANPTLSPDTLIVIEHPSNIDFSDHPSFEKKAAYSAVNFSFFNN